MLHEKLPILVWWSCVPHLRVGVASWTLAVGDVDDGDLYDPQPSKDGIRYVDASGVVHSFVLCRYEF